MKIDIEPLTWKDDPLLVDDELKWVTEKKGIKEYVNLYRALIKPEAFFIGTRVLGKIPHLTGNELAVYLTRLLEEKFGSFDNGFLKAVKALEKYTGTNYAKIHKAKYRYKEKLKEKRINIILARVISLLASEDMNESISIFNEFLNKSKYVSNKGGRYIKLPILLSDLLDNKLIYLAGVIAGDGHLDERRKQIVIADGYVNEDKLNSPLRYIEQLFNKTFNINCMIRDLGNYQTLTICNSCACNVFNYFFEIDFGNKCDKIHIPGIIKENPGIEGIFWRGLFDADAGIRKNAKGIHFVTKSRILGEHLKIFCCKNNISLTKRIRKNGAYEFYIASADYQKYAHSIGFSHPRKRRNLLKQLKEGPDYTIFGGVDNKKISGCYYDFSESDLCVSGTGNMMHNIRTNLGLTLKEIGNKVGLNKKAIWRFEQNEISVPISILIKVWKLHNNSKNSFYKMLENSNVKFSVHGSKNKVTLPLRPEKRVMEALKCLRTHKNTNAVYVKISDNLENANEKDIYKKLKGIGKVFGMQPITVIKSNRKHNQFYLCSKAINIFLKTFHMYELPWKPFSDKEIGMLIESLSLDS